MTEPADLMAALIASLEKAHPPYDPDAPIVLSVNDPTFMRADDGAVVWRSTGRAVFNPRHARRVIWTDKEPA